RPISFVSCAASHPYLPSFPTRRSSDLGHVNHGVESLYLNLGQSLFPGFTGCSLHCGFSVFHKACRQGPVAVSGFDSATAKKNPPDRKSTRLNSSHVKISYAVFCLKKKK